MPQKRHRKNNWTQLENQKLEVALQKYGRADIQKIVDFLTENLSDFHRSYKDVKKKIYNQLQDDIIHEISVKVRINLTYSLLTMLKQENKPIQPLLEKISKFCGHSIQRIETNMKILEEHVASMCIGMASLRKIQRDFDVQDYSNMLLENHLYKKVLYEFKEALG